MYSEENHSSIVTTNLELLGENKERKRKDISHLCKVLAAALGTAMLKSDD